MRYQGSKKKLLKYLKPIIEGNINTCKYYVEPFAGGFNCFSHINFKNKIGNDLNKYTIALWNDIKNGSFIKRYGDFIKNLTKDQYQDVYSDYKNNGNKYSDSLKGYIGFACSNSSGWWKGYANFNKKKNENHILEAYNGLKKQIDNFLFLKDCKLENISYDKLKIPNNSFIYCDPPYRSTEGYKVGFDNDQFWEWCRKQVSKGNMVLVSEFSAPDDFIKIFSKTMQNGYGVKNQNKTENLYIHKKQVNNFDCKLSA